MKRNILFLAGFCLGAAGAFAQQTVTPDITPAAGGKPVVITTTRPLKVSGPLVQPLKARGISDASKQVLQLVNPFARSEPKPEGESLPTPVERRAWSTVVGWNPGASAFPNEVTHRPSLTLVSVSRAK